MKMHIWLATCVIFCFSVALALVSAVHAREGSVDDKSGELDGFYTGSTVLNSTSCFPDGDCSTCTTDQKVELTRGGGKVTIVATGPALTYTPCRVDTSTTLAWTLTGTYEMTEEGIHKFQINDCNEGRFPGSGSGTIDGEQIDVSFSCTKDDNGSIERWNNVALMKQSGGDGGDEGDETAADDESATEDDPNIIGEGETDNNITVDKMVGDATVSKIPGYPLKKMITTGSRSKAKIHFGDSEIVIGPNSQLIVNTATNKFGQPVIMWEFLNPQAVIYVKDSLHGTRQVDSGYVEGSTDKRIFTNLWRSIMIFYGGTYQGKKDLGEFYRGETNEPEFFNPGKGERSVIVGIKGTEYYYQATESGRTLFLNDGEIDLYSSSDSDLVALAAGEKVTVAEDGTVGPPVSYTSAEIEALAKEVDLTEQSLPKTDSLSTTTIAIIVAGASAALALIFLFILLRSRSGKKAG